MTYTPGRSPIAAGHDDRRADGRPARRSRRSTSSSGPRARRGHRRRHRDVVRPQPELRLAYSEAVAGQRFDTDRASPTSTWCCSPPEDASGVAHRGQRSERGRAGRTVVVMPPGRQRDRGGVGRAGGADLLGPHRGRRRAVPQRGHVHRARIPTSRRGAVAGSGRRPSHPRLPAGRRAGRAGPLRPHAPLQHDHGQLLPSDDGARDPSKLSPHHHDDFEQISLQLQGSTTSTTCARRGPSTWLHWRDDEHHSRRPGRHDHPAADDAHQPEHERERHQLIDIFCPPRVDFSQRPGWVLNADEYPMP